MEHSGANKKPTIDQYLQGLGDTSEHVASNLFKEGIKGIPKNACYCAVIVAIHKHWPTTDPHLTAPRPGVITWNDCQTIDPCCTQAVTQFMKDFDDRKYPFLEGTAQRETVMVEKTVIVVR